MKSWMYLAALALVGCPESGKDEPDDTDTTETADDTDTTSTDDGTWHEIATGLDGAVLNITGTSAHNVWIVGSEGNTSVPTLLHWDGVAWDTIDTSAHSGDYWWGWLNGEDDVWVVGAGGKVRRYQPSTDTWTSDESVSEVFTLFGIWGSGPNDVWTVGGNLDAPSNGAGAWHYDGAAWTRADLPAEASNISAIYKVWGRSADDVWMVGSKGLAIHWDGSAWTATTTNTTTTLFTVNGDPDGEEVWAVGGQGNAVVLRWDGSAWTDETPQFSQTIPGVYAGGTSPRAAGYGGTVYVRDGSPATWHADPRGQGGFFDFHTVWEDDEGGVWGGGGVISSNPTRDGKLIYGGPNPPAPYAP